jgi:hypothetical protein
MQTQCVFLFQMVIKVFTQIIHQRLPLLVMIKKYIETEKE